VVAADIACTERCAMRITVSEDGAATLDPLGVAFTANAITTHAVTAIARLFDDAATLPGEPTSADPPPIATSGAGDQFDSDLASRVDGAALQVRLASPPPAVPMPALLVRVLGVPSVPDRPALGRREIALTVFLACRDRPVTAAAVQDALWNGRAVEPKTLWNMVATARSKLGTLDDGRVVLPAADRTANTLCLADGVETDIGVLRRCVELAAGFASSEAIGALRRGVELVEGPPFDAPGYDWAHHGTQDVAEASALIETAVERLVGLAREHAELDVARHAIQRGLRGLPGNEVLYRLRMRVEHQAGNLAAVAAVYDELVRFLSELDTTPSPATTALRNDLLHRQGPPT
jgi:hypothetical protein